MSFAVPPGGVAGRGWWPVPLAVTLAVAAGASVALAPPLAAILAGLPLVILLLESAKLRFATFVIGGVAAFGSSADLSILKFVYLVVLLVALVGAWWSMARATLAGELDARIYRGALIGGGLIVGLIAMSLPAALAAGNSFGLWFRDASPYLLVGVAPFFATDARHSLGSDWRSRVFVAAGIITTLSFAAHFLAVRETATLSIDRLLLASFFLPAALFSYASSRALGHTGRSALRWGGVAGGVFAIMLLTGTRSALLLLIAPVTIAVLTRRLLQRRAAQLTTAAVAILLGILIVFQVGAGVAGVSSGETRERLLTTRSLVQSPSTDQSLYERRQQSEEAWALFRESPVVGAGPGHVYQWSSFGGIIKSGFSVDTSVTVLAKFGLIGVVAFAAFFALMGRLTRTPVGDRNDVVARTAPLTAFGLIALLYLAGGNPLEDKGFAIGLMALLSFALPPSGSAAPAPLEPSHRPGALA